MEQIEQAVMYALGPQVDPSLKQQVRRERELEKQRNDERSPFSKFSLCFQYARSLNHLKTNR